MNGAQPSRKLSIAGRIGRHRPDQAHTPYGRGPAVALISVNALDGLDWGVLIGVLSLLQDDWGFSDAWGGAIATAATVAGLAVLLPAGWMSDHLPRARLLGLVVATWAVLQGASAASVGFAMFFFTRMLLGAAAHIDNPLASSLLADYYPPVVRGRVFGFQRLAYAVGLSAGIGVGGGVGDLLGWRAAFLVTIAPSVVVALVCLALREPARGGLDGAQPAAAPEPENPGTRVGHAVALLEEMELGSEAAYAEERARGVRAYLRETRATLRIPTVRSLYVGLTVAFIGFNGIAYWLPEFWERTHDVSESTASIVTAVISLVVAIAGSIVGGVLGDRWSRQRPGGRIDIVVLGLVSGAVVLFVALALPTLASQAVVLGAAAFLLVLTFPNLAAATADVLPAARRGMGFALFTFLVQAGSALGPLLVGIVSDLSGSLGIALAMSVVPTIPGALVVRRARHTIAADIARARSG